MIKKNPTKTIRKKIKIWMLKTGLRIEIRSKLSEIADPALISRYYKKYVSEKNRKIDAQYSTRHPNPVKTERDSRSYTNFKMLQKNIRKNIFAFFAFFTPSH